MYASVHLSIASNLADVVVGVTLQLDRHAPGEEGAEALAARPRHADVDGVRRQSLLAMFAVT